MTQERFFELVYAWKDGDLTGDELYQRVFVLSNVVKSLPTDEQIYSKASEYVRKIKQPNRQPLITLRRTFKAGAMFVKSQFDY